MPQASPTFDPWRAPRRRAVAAPVRLRGAAGDKQGSRIERAPRSCAASYSSARRSLAAPMIFNASAWPCGRFPGEENDFSSATFGRRSKKKVQLWTASVSEGQLLVVIISCNSSAHAA
jgi:hypothetical protein